MKNKRLSFTLPKPVLTTQEADIYHAEIAKRLNFLRNALISIKEEKGFNGRFSIAKEIAQLPSCIVGYGIIAKDIRALEENELRNKSYRKTLQFYCQVIGIDFQKIKLIFDGGIQDWSVDQWKEYLQE